jgi:hypothetical protein
MKRCGMDGSYQFLQLILISQVQPCLGYYDIVYINIHICISMYHRNLASYRAGPFAGA